MKTRELSISVKSGHFDPIIPELDETEQIIDVHTTKLDEKRFSSLSLEGALITIKDELLKYGISYFYRKKLGFFKKAAIPLLFSDENLEYMGKVSINAPKNQKRANQHLFSTNRRLIVINPDFVLSFWFLIDSSDYLSFIESNTPDITTEVKQLLRTLRHIDIYFLQGSWFFGKQVVIGWYTETSQRKTSIQADKLINPFTFRGSAMSSFNFKKSSENITNEIIAKAESGLPTKLTELIAMEDYCLKSSNVFYHPLMASFNADKLISGRLNLGLKRNPI